LKNLKTNRNIESIKNVIKDLQNILLDVTRLEKLHEARQKDVEYFGKVVAKLQEQNQKLSSQVEKHIEEKNNGNWAREGAVVWDSEYKIKGVLLKHPNDNELHFVCFIQGSGIEDWPFYENKRNTEPYNGQDKEEVEDVVFENTIEVGEIWQSNEHENRVIVITQIDNLDESTQELKVMNLKKWERAEKGSFQFLRSDYLLENFTKKPLFVLKR